MKHNHKYFVYYCFLDKENNKLIENIEVIHSVKAFKQRSQERNFIYFYIKKVW